MVEYKILTT